MSETSPAAATYTEMLERARAIDPKAKVRLDGHQWVILIETGIEEAYRLPPEFDGTPAAEMFASSDSGEPALERWARKNGHGSSPLHVIAEYFNIGMERHALHDEWLERELAARGLRTRRQIIDGNDAAEEEKALLREYYATPSPAAAYAAEKLKPRLEALWDAGF